MLKKKFFIILGLIFYTLIFSKRSLANCNFKTANYIEELNTPNLIKDIDINVIKSKKYTINLIKSLLSSSTSRKAINSKYKKKFNANINVNYNFGSCSYTGKVWQNGDWKDHIRYSDGKLVRSLNIKLNNGNILNATKFKLFIPETRNGKNEILATLVLKNLGFITPETFEVFVDVNDNKSIMIFQEDSQKELLERNLRREGPIFEGDESLIWGDKQYALKGGVGGGGLEEVSLARLINYKWFLKGKSSQQISLNALEKIQNAYLEYSDKYLKDGYYISPNNELNDKFSDYSFLMLSMSGYHGLRPHNRKYYFNSFINKFEPIYYDGDVNFMDKSFVNNQIKDKKIKLFFNKNYNFPYLEKIKSKAFFDYVKNQFKLRVLEYTKDEESFLFNSYKNFLENIDVIQEEIKISNINLVNNQNINEQRNIFLEKNNELGLEKNIIKKFRINGDKVIIEKEGGLIFNMNLYDFSRVLARKNFNKEMFLFLPFKNFYNTKSNLIKTKLIGIDTEIVHDDSVDIILEKSNKKQKLFIYQSLPDQAVLINGGNLRNLEIIFIGSSNNLKKDNKQRFNNRGLTGCLNIYNANLNNVSITIENGKCEDSLNLINSKGNIAFINIKDSFQDALDLDFSNILINETKITNAGNDCIDVSGGSYILKNSLLKKCKDKAISVGEKSNLLSKKLIIESSNIGIAVKDLSYFNSNNTNISDTPICAQIFQKKQEFGGAYANLKKINCLGKYELDEKSILNY